MKRTAPLLCLIPFLLSGVYFWAKQAPFAAGADASGYMSFASLIAEGRLSQPPLTMAFGGMEGVDRRVFEPLGFQYEAHGDELVSIYPSGLPLLFAAAETVLPRSIAVSIVLLLCFVATGPATCGLSCQVGLRPVYALLAYLTIIGSSLTLFIGVNPMTDVLSLGLVTGVFLLASQIERGRSWGLVLGFVLAFAVLVRPTNLLIVPAVVWFLGHQGQWRLLPFILAGALPGIAWFLFINQTLYGSALRIGYGSIQHLMAFNHLWPNLRHFAVWLTILFTPILIWPFFLAPFFGAVLRRKLTPLFLWSVPFFTFYAFYSFSNHDWWFTRFLLPAIPPVVVGSALVWQTTAEARLSPTFARRLPWLLLAFVACSHLVVGEWKGPNHIRRGHIVYQEVGSWIGSHTQPGDAIVCMQLSGAVAYYTNERPLFRWDFLSQASWDALKETAAGNGHDLYAALAFNELAAPREWVTRAPGNWEEVVRFPYATIFRLTDCPATHRKTPR